MAYIVTTIISSSTPLKLPITHVYSCHPKQKDSHSPPAPPSRDPSLDLPIALRKGKQRCSHPISSFASYEHLSPTLGCFITSLNFVSLPKTLREALPHPSWWAVIEEELLALNENGNWDLVHIPTSKQAIGCKPFNSMHQLLYFAN